MLIATMTQPGTMTLSETEKPAAGPGQVLLEVRAVGICGSDIHAWHGKHPFVSCPVVPGHEAAGRVAQVGQGVQGFKEGDRVTFMPQEYCTECEPCKNGRYNICNHLKVIGCQSGGAAAQYLAVPAKLVKKLPEGMSYAIGATVEPAAVGVHAARRVPGGLKGKNVAVLGAGTIGNLVAQACMALGAQDVLIADLSDYRLDLAKACGIPRAVNNGKQDLAAAIEAAFGPQGCDVFFECVGIGATANTAIQLAKKGSDIIIVGVYGDRPPIDMALVQDKELCLIGALMYIEEDYDATIKWMADGTIKTAPLIAKSFQLEEYQQAFDYIDANADTAVKVLVMVNGGEGV